MLIIGADYHPGFQTIAFLDEETGEYGERELKHPEEAEEFYRRLRGRQVRVGMEATGHAGWFEALLAELNFELWLGDPATIRSKRVRKQKHDREDARLLLRLLRNGEFPRIWIPDLGNRDLRQLLWHRHRLVQMRTRVQNQLQAFALNAGIRRKKRLWSQAGREQLEALPLAPWSGHRREDLLKLLDQLEPRIEELTAAVKREAEQCPTARLLMTHPGVGPITGLAFVLILGNAERFHCGKQVSSYLGLIPAEDSSGGRQRLGHISKQGNTLLRFLLVEAAHVLVRVDAEWRNRFFHLAMRRGRTVANVAMARKLAVRLYWMWRKGQSYEQTLRARCARGEA